MNIILVGKLRGKPVRVQLAGHGAVALFGIGLLSLTVMIAGAAYWFGTTQGKITQLTELKESIEQQKELIQETRFNAQSDLDALTKRVGKMQANVTRINAFGKRLVKISKLDAKEFDFDNQPAYGGPVEATAATDQQFSEVLDTLDTQLQSSNEKLGILEDVLLSKLIRFESKPAGRPIEKGWISSYYGMRADPFSGKQAMHKGMDFAGKSGSNVIAAASGVVTWSGKRYGYGKLVEINHGNGYATRYGHNAEILVEIGDTVEKGQAIALMGSTGRSTGPHVHYEVLLNDRQINPTKFVQNKG